PEVLVGPVADGVGHPLLVPVLRVHHRRRADLPVVREAGRLPRLLPRLGEHWEQNGGQDGNNGNDDEKLDQRETVSSLHGGPPAPRFAAAGPSSCRYWVIGQRSAPHLDIACR